MFDHDGAADGAGHLDAAVLAEARVTLLDQHREQRVVVAADLADDLALVEDRFVPAVDGAAAYDVDQVFAAFVVCCFDLGGEVGVGGLELGEAARVAAGSAGGFAFRAAFAERGEVDVTPLLGDRGAFLASVHGSRCPLEK